MSANAGANASLTDGGKRSAERRSKARRVLIFRRDKNDFDVWRDAMSRRPHAGRFGASTGCHIARLCFFPLKLLNLRGRHFRGGKKVSMGLSSTSFSQLARPRLTFLYLPLAACLAVCCTTAGTESLVRLVSSSCSSGDRPRSRSRSIPIKSVCQRSNPYRVSCEESALTRFSMQVCRR